MASRLTISYDEKGDLLEIALGSIRPAIAKELIPDLFVRYDLATFDEEKNEGKEIVGFTVANLSLWEPEDFRRLDLILQRDLTIPLERARVYQKFINSITIIGKDKWKDQTYF